MKIRIAHLYYDLMNLYGENGNIRALKNHFERQEIETEISFLTIGDKIDFNKYDIFYIGSGTEKYQLLVIEDMLKRKDDFINAINSNKYFFITGNAIEMFGKYIIDFNNKKIDCLGMFNYYTEMVNIEHYSDNVEFRIIGESLATCSLIDKKIIGFQNRSGVIQNNELSWIKVIKGCGNTINDKSEGVMYKNFYATYTIGPLFIRNPYLTEYFTKKIILEKNDTFKFKIYLDTSDIKAYNTYLDNQEK